MINFSNLPGFTNAVEGARKYDKTSAQMQVITKYEKIPADIYEDSDNASKAVAHEIASLIREKAERGQKCVLGLPTGSTPKKVYQELVRLHREEGLSFKNVVTFNLDEYFSMPRESRQSYYYYMYYHLFNHVDVDPKNVHIPDGTVSLEDAYDYCKRYEEKLNSLGGMDLQLLGIGRTGHIGFNEPGSLKNSQTRLITLDNLTRIDASEDFGSINNVPMRAITMGIGSILKARRVILMALGEKKAPIIKKTLEGPLSEMVPATYLHDHSNAKVVLDSAAASKLTRVNTPWLVDSCQWDRRLIRRAVVWLCQKLDKPILKLTTKDYNDNGLSDLLAKEGSAYNINIRVFNDLQHTITGWPGGKPHADDTKRPERREPAQKRVIIFSPHPDDDVISMGGTLHRLVDQNHEVHVAYHVSGNIAVNDDYATRFLSFVNLYTNFYDPDNERLHNKYEEIRSFLEQKQEGDVDSQDLLRIKALIRKGEAKSACRYMGVRSKRAHFMDMPFYETGLVEKNPLGQEDIDLLVKLLREVKPHQVYAAGDLSDPHGTHRVCLEALLQAFDVVKNDQWWEDTWVWFYRGAWQEWDIHQIDMAVPISPEELIKKREAIFKHQSQKEGAMYPGEDSREFWKRAEDRNRNTANLYDKLGMAEYEAIEAFVRFRPQ